MYLREGLEMGQSSWWLLGNTLHFPLRIWWKSMTQMSVMRGNNDTTRYEKQNILSLRELRKMGNEKCIDYLKTCKYKHLFRCILFSTIPCFYC